MKSIFDRLYPKQRQADDVLDSMNAPSTSIPDILDVENFAFPLVPDDYHLQYVGKTVQGNGYWIDFQLAVEDGDTRDFIAAYVFDRTGNLIWAEVIDRGLRSRPAEQTAEEIIRKLVGKIDAKETTEILVKPFSISFLGHTFGLVVREREEDDDAEQDTIIDVMPGHTLMFYGPWGSCNYDT